MTEKFRAQVCQILRRRARPRDRCTPPRCVYYGSGTEHCQVTHGHQVRYTTSLQMEQPNGQTGSWEGVKWIYDITPAQTNRNGQGVEWLPVGGLEVRLPAQDMGDKAPVFAGSPDPKCICHGSDIPVARPLGKDRKPGGRRRNRHRAGSPQNTGGKKD